MSQPVNELASQSASQLQTSIHQLSIIPIPFLDLFPASSYSRFWNLGQRLPIMSQSCISTPPIHPSSLYWVYTTVISTDCLFSVFVWRSSYLTTLPHPPHISSRLYSSPPVPSLPTTRSISPPLREPINPISLASQLVHPPFCIPTPVPLQPPPHREARKKAKKKKRVNIRIPQPAQKPRGLNLFRETGPARGRGSVERGSLLPVQSGESLLRGCCRGLCGWWMVSIEI